MILPTFDVEKYNSNENVEMDRHRVKSLQDVQECCYCKLEIVEDSSNSLMRAGTVDLWWAPTGSNNNFFARLWTH